MKMWPEDVAAMPTEITRTAIFGLLQTNQKKYLQMEQQEKF